MKRIITLLAIVALCQFSAFGQKKYEMVVEKTDGTEIIVNVDDIVRTYFRERGGSFDITYCPDGNHPHMIDLGLPSGTKWACCNVGASNPEDFGGYYAWGETLTKNRYAWDTYLYGSSNSNVVNIGSDISGTQYDVAHVSWGGGWHMPNLTEATELVEKCTYQQAFVELNGVRGRKITGPNGNSIFLPFSGVFIDNEIKWVGQVGDYWLSELWPDEDNSAYWLYNFVDEDGDYNDGEGFRYVGYTVRPVTK